MLLTKPEHSLKAIEYYLEKIIPRNTHINVINPKKILLQLLPEIAKQKNCTIQTNNNKEFLKKIIENKTYAQKQPELNIIELDYITEDGGLITPTQFNKNIPTIGISSINNLTTNNSQNYDFIKPDKIVSEIGIYKPENIIQEINAFS
jgi:hypothetical protein